jgi:hypothetical protein
MGIFDIFKKEKGPYQEYSTNRIYELLFCDYNLYRNGEQDNTTYPWSILFSDEYRPVDIKEIIESSAAESRVKILAYKAAAVNGSIIEDKDLLAVIIEVALDEGLDVLASFKDGTARYINHSGKILIWENEDNESVELTRRLFDSSNRIVQQIGPWNEPRKPHPLRGMVRISFLVSDQLYFGEAPMDVLFNDELAGPALMAATQLMKYITEKALQQ